MEWGGDNLSNNRLSNEYTLVCGIFEEKRDVIIREDVQVKKKPNGWRRTPGWEVEGEEEKKLIFTRVEEKKKYV